MGSIHIYSHIYIYPCILDTEYWIQTTYFLDTEIYNKKINIFYRSSEVLTLQVLKGTQTADTSHTICESEYLKLFDPINLIVMNRDEI